MVTQQPTPSTGSGEETALEEVYRRVVEVHAALEEVIAVDRDLHHWCERKLGDLLAFIDARTPLADEDVSAPPTA